MDWKKVLRPTIWNLDLTALLIILSLLVNSNILVLGYFLTFIILSLIPGIPPITLGSPIYSILIYFSNIILWYIVLSLVFNHLLKRTDKSYVLKAALFLRPTKFRIAFVVLYFILIILTTHYTTDVPRSTGFPFVYEVTGCYYTTEPSNCVNEFYPHLLLLDILIPLGIYSGIGMINSLKSRSGA